MLSFGWKQIYVFSRSDLEALSGKRLKNEESVHEHRRTCVNNTKIIDKNCKVRKKNFNIRQ